MRAGRHAPERVALLVHGVVALRLRRRHGHGERRVPKNLLGDVALCERGEGLIEVHMSVLTEFVPFVPIEFVSV